jgi:hypothetical protein
MDLDQTLSVEDFESTKENSSEDQKKSSRKELNSERKNKNQPRENKDDPKLENPQNEDQQMGSIDKNEEEQFESENSPDIPKVKEQQEVKEAMKHEGFNLDIDVAGINGSSGNISR